MQTESRLAVDTLLDMALRRCLLTLAEWQQARPPLDPGVGEICRDLELTASRSFDPAELEVLVADESRLHALTQWALFALLSKPYIIQFTSGQIRWRSASVPTVMLRTRADGRQEAVWSWLVQFCAPEGTDNLYLNRMGHGGAQMTLFE